MVDGLVDAISGVAPDAILLSGDLTQRARAGEYRRAKAFLDRLPVTPCLVPGNHDLAAFNLAERFLMPWKRWRNEISDNLEPRLESMGYVVKGINTARRLGDRMDWSRGGINARQLDAVEAAFSGVEPGALRLLMAHHPLWLPEPHAHRHLVDGRDAAIPRLAAAGVDLVLSGHIHVAFSRVINGMIVSHAGTGVSNRLLPGYPNSFNVIRGDRTTLSLELMEWDNGRFRCSSVDGFIRRQGAWTASSG